MNQESKELYNIDNSDVIKHVIFSLVNVSRPKTSSDYAWAIIKDLLNELNHSYSFLKYIVIDEIESLNDTIDDIDISLKINSVAPIEIGKAIQSFIDIYKIKMGTKAGYFFIQEFKEDLGINYNSIIKEMGVDLRLIELKEELSGISSQEIRIKDDVNSNIAFIEKKDL